jgi:hypothetical protein
MVQFPIRSHYRLTDNRAEWQKEVRIPGFISVVVDSISQCRNVLNIVISPRAPTRCLFLCARTPQRWLYRTNTPSGSGLLFRGAPCADSIKHAIRSIDAIDISIHTLNGQVLPHFPAQSSVLALRDGSACSPISIMRRRRVIPLEIELATSIGKSPGRSEMTASTALGN